jgi:hypothetical protein
VQSLRTRLEEPSPTIEERVGLLRALAIADESATDVLTAEAGPRRRRFGFLSPGELDPLRRDLVLALRSVLSPAARSYLQLCAQSEDRPLRKHAEEALRGSTQKTQLDGSGKIMTGEGFKI